jgi:pyruvate-ferredoxin/flavodoxin oxidoreductase
LIINNPQKDESDIYEQREKVTELNKKLEDLQKTSSGEKATDFKHLLSLTDYLVKKSVWIMGGDGWAYDIGYGGLDHVLASGKNVNILVLDTEVYSNTGGQCSKATPRGAVAKFAAAGKPAAKKDLGLMAMSYGNVYVAKVAMGANDQHTLRAFLEAEAYDGPSIIIAYSHCIAHGINMGTAMQNQKAAVDSGYWQLYRYNPELEAEGKNPFKLEDYAYLETRYKMLTKSHPKEAEVLIKEAQEDVVNRWKEYERIAAYTPDGSNGKEKNQKRNKKEL